MIHGLNQENICKALLLSVSVRVIARTKTRCRALANIKGKGRAPSDGRQDKSKTISPGLCSLVCAATACIPLAIASKGRD